MIEYNFMEEYNKLIKLMDPYMSVTEVIVQINDNEGLYENYT